MKFLRFAQRKIDQAGEGIVALRHQPRLPRQPHLPGPAPVAPATFDEIHLLDLHGNGKKKERAPDGSADANVFEGVRQGAAVALLVKRPGLPKRVLRADLRGSRSAKLRWLAERRRRDPPPGREIAPRGPAFLFAPRDAALEAEYRRGVPLTEIFPEHSVGIVTGRDAFAIDTDPAALRPADRGSCGRDRRPSEVLPDGCGRGDPGAAGWRRRAGSPDRRGLAGRGSAASSSGRSTARTIFYADYVSSARARR